MDICIYMDKELTCPVCQKCFSRNNNMKRHLITIHAPERSIKESEKYPCPICQKTFARASCVKRHTETVHKHDPPIKVGDPIVSILISKINQLEENNEILKTKLEENNEKQKQRDDKLDQRLNEIKNKSAITNNQILNVICVTNHDNYLDMLTDQMGDFDQAIEYIRGCALSDLVGDCKLIEKIYANQNHELSFSINQKNSNVTYHNEQQQLVTENKDTFGRKLANNLQNSYLKGVNHLIQRNLDHKRDPNQLLDEYDLITWNHHIYHLSESLHQRRLLGQLKLPIQMV